MPLPEGLVRLAEDAANRLLRHDPDALDRLAALDGKVLRVVVEDADLALFLRPFGGGLRLHGDWPAAPDVTVRGPLRGYLRLLARRGDPRVLFQGAVTLEGEVEVAQRLHRALQGLNLDWEALAADWLGEAPARALGRTARAGWAWLRHAGATLALDLAEYLRDERGELLGPGPVTRFAAEVDALRLDVERAAQRVQRLLDRCPP